MLNCYSILQTHEFMIVVLITYTPAHIQYTVYNTLNSNSIFSCELHNVLITHLFIIQTIL